MRLQGESRRDFARAASLVALLAAAGLLQPGRARAQQPGWNKAAFDAKNLSDTLKALGSAGAVESKEIQITAPDIAENGAVVPITVASRLANTQALYILVDKNPSWLAAGFTFAGGTEPNVTTRVKMAQTANVIAVARSGDRFYMAAKEVKVTLGGCGG